MLEGSPVSAFWVLGLQATAMSDSFCVYSKDYNSGSHAVGASILSPEPTIQANFYFIKG